MTDKTARSRGRVLCELFEFIRREEPTWPEGAVLHDELVDQRVHVEMLVSEEHINALARVHSRCGVHDEGEAQAMMSLTQALLRGGFPR